MNYNDHTAMFNVQGDNDRIVLLLLLSLFVRPYRTIASDVHRKAAASSTQAILMLASPRDLLTHLKSGICLLRVCCCVI